MGESERNCVAEKGEVREMYSALNKTQLSLNLMQLKENSRLNYTFPKAFMYSRMHRFSVDASMKCTCFFCAAYNKVSKLENIHFYKGSRGPNLRSSHGYAAKFVSSDNWHCQGRS